ncbi:MAG: hypothetical protein WHS82_04725 [Candidatus Methanosuratincola sp.]
MIILTGIFVNLVITSPVSSELMDPENQRSAVRVNDFVSQSSNRLSGEALSQAVDKVLSDPEVLILIDYLIQQNFTLQSDNPSGLRTNEGFKIRMRFKTNDGTNTCRDGAFIIYSETSGEKQAIAIWSKDGQGYMRGSNNLTISSGCYACLCNYEIWCCESCGSFWLPPCGAFPCNCYVMDCANPFFLICWYGCMDGQCAACQGCPC